MNEIIGLGVTLLLGLFILVGSIIVFFTKNNDKFIKFSIGLALGVLIMVILTDLIPEAYESFSEVTKPIYAILIILGITLVGIFILKLFDLFIPNHDHNHKEKDHHIDEHNLYHIGIISSIALILHNIIEGMAIYNTFINDPKTGIFIGLGVGLHNIPLGIIIASAFYKKNKSIKKTIFISFIISISTFVGGLIIYLLSSNINEIVSGVFICLTLGMIIYISFFELLKEVLCKEKRKTALLGVLTGIILIVVSMLVID